MRSLSVDNTSIHDMAVANEQCAPEQTSVLKHEGLPTIGTGGE